MLDLYESDLAGITVFGTESVFEIDREPNPRGLDYLKNSATIARSM